MNLYCWDPGPVFKNSVFRIVTPCSLADTFQRNCCCHHYGLPLMMEAAISSEKSVNYYQTKRRHILQANSLYNHSNENNKSHKVVVFSSVTLSTHRWVFARNEPLRHSWVICPLDSGTITASGSRKHGQWTGQDRTGTRRTQKKRRRKEKESKVPMLNISMATCRCLTNTGTAPFIPNLGSRRIWVATFTTRPC